MGRSLPQGVEFGVRALYAARLQLSCCLLDLSMTVGSAQPPLSAMLWGLFATCVSLDQEPLFLRWIVGMLNRFPGGVIGGATPPFNTDPLDDLTGNVVRFLAIGGASLCVPSINAPFKDTSKRPLRRFRLKNVGNCHATKSNFLSGKAKLGLKLRYCGCTDFSAENMHQEVSSGMQTGVAPGHHPLLGSPSALSLASEVTMRFREACSSSRPPCWLTRWTGALSLNPGLRCISLISTSP